MAGPVLDAKNVIVMDLTWSLLPGSLQPGAGEEMYNYSRSLIDGRLLI